VTATTPSFPSHLFLFSQKNLLLSSGLFLPRHWYFQTFSPSRPLLRRIFLTVRGEATNPPTPPSDGTVRVPRCSVPPRGFGEPDIHRSIPPSPSYFPSSDPPDSFFLHDPPRNLYSFFFSLSYYNEDPSFFFLSRPSLTVDFRPPSTKSSRRQQLFFWGGGGRLTPVFDLF